MILQALTKLYDDLVARGEISSLGWSKAKISYALSINHDGELVEVISTQVEKQDGKKPKLLPQEMTLPLGVTRSSGERANFMWDNSSYLLCVDDKGKPERTKKCFAAAQKLHHELLDDVDSPIAKAVLKYFDTWSYEKAANIPSLQENLDGILKGGNLVFLVDGVFAQDDGDIRLAWDRYYSKSEGELTQCLVTGKLDVPEEVHPSIKGVKGAQPTGAAIVSFNAQAFCSYGKTQSLNAPVGKKATFAYTTALNHLLADRDNCHYIGDTAVVCWAEGAEPEYCDFYKSLLYGDKTEKITTADLVSVIDKLSQGLPCEELKLDLSRKFYILGLAPNAGRLSVRFFFNNTFGELMKNVSEHHKRLEIVGKRYEITPMWALLNETVNQNSKDKTPSPVMAGAAARAVFSGTAYPASLLNATMLRIRAEREVTPGRAAIIKAYYLKNENNQCPKEVLTVGLNESSTNIAYTLGRLFAVYEAVQEAANPGINATIKDKYFNSASATPAAIFPILDNLAQKHLRKLSVNQRIYFDKQIGSLKNILGETNPARLMLPEQGSFVLGYYHQKEARYTKKEEM